MMAYDVELLREKVKDSGMKIEPLAKAVGLTREGFYKKLDRRTEYLRLSEDDRRKIFLI